MELSDNKTVVRRYLEETVVQGNFEVFDTSFAPDLVYHISNTPPHNHASYRNLLKQLHQAMSGHALTIHDLVAEGNTVAVRTSYSATTYHSHFGKNRPTGQPVHVETTYFFHFEQGQVTEVWASYDGPRFDHTGFGE